MKTNRFLSVGTVALVFVLLGARVAFAEPVLPVDAGAVNDTIENAVGPQLDIDEQIDQTVDSLAGADGCTVTATAPVKQTISVGTYVSGSGAATCNQTDTVSTGVKVCVQIKAAGQWHRLACDAGEGAHSAAASAASPCSQGKFSYRTKTREAHVTVAIGGVQPSGIDNTVFTGHATSAPVSIRCF